MRHSTRWLLVWIAAGLLTAPLSPLAQTPDPFHAAMRAGDVATMATLLDKDPGLATRPDRMGVPPIFWAVTSGHRAVLDLVIARGGVVDAPSPFGLPIHAAVFGGQPDMVRALASKGADVNAGGPAGIPPLVLAARRGLTPGAEALLAAGATADIRDGGGNTPLLLAASYGHEPIVRALMAKRADTSAVNQFGISAIEAAQREGHAAIEQVLRSAGAALRSRPAPEGPYLGQTPPAEARRVFSGGFVSTERRELNAAFTPDGRTLFFSRDRSPRGTRMLMTVRSGDGWQPPVPAPFSLGDDVDMFVTVDGREVYFCSDAPVPGQPPRDASQPAPGEPPVDIWLARRQGDSWGPAEWLGPEINSPAAADYYPTLTRDGTLYFSSNRPGGLGENDIYRARRVGGRWAPPENLGPVVNSAGREFDPFIAPDESYLIFASERPGGLGQSDLYLSVRHADGTWGTPVNLGPAVNSPFGDYTPMLSPDGRYLFLTSGGAGSDDIYWIDASVIRKAVAATCVSGPLPPAP